MVTLEELITKNSRKKSKDFVFYNQKIMPGESVAFALPLPEIFGCAPYYMPVKIFHGKTTGPVLLVFSTINGDELNGMEICNLLIKHFKNKPLKGTLIVVPSLDIFGMLNRSKIGPDNQRLENSFPGNTTGSYTSRTAYVFTNEILKKVDCCIELKTGPLNRKKLPRIIANLEKPINKDLAKVFPVPLINPLSLKEGNLHTWADNHDLPYITYEAGEALRENTKYAKIGLRGIIRIMNKLKMIHGKETNPKIKPHIIKKSLTIFASKSGLVSTDSFLGKKVKKGDIIADIKDPIGAFDDKVVTSPVDGIVININTLPLVYEGEVIFEIALFDEIDKVTEQFNEWYPEEEKIENTQ